jgi:hypothetical protein
MVKENIAGKGYNNYCQLRERQVRPSEHFMWFTLFFKIYKNNFVKFSFLYIC